MNRNDAGRLGALKTNIKHSADRTQRIASYNTDPKRCSHCDKPLDYDKRRHRFCGHSCAASFSNRGVRRHGTAPGRCQRCDKQLLRAQSKFCGGECDLAFKQEALYATFAVTGVLNCAARTARKYLLVTRGQRCEICKIETWRDRPVPVVMDHINGDPTDQRILNLRLVCPNCDALLPTFKGRNRGNGRHARRARYIQGKSY